MSVMFGVRFPRTTTSLYQDFWKMIAIAVELSSPAEQPPIDIFPILEWIPERWAQWKAKARDLKNAQEGVFRRMLMPVERRLEEGTGNESFMEEVYQRAEEWGLDEAALL
jgi:hypothetical protein